MAKVSGLLFPIGDQGFTSAFTSFTTNMGGIFGTEIGFNSAVLAAFVDQTEQLVAGEITSRRMARSGSVDHKVQGERAMAHDHQPDQPDGDHHRHDDHARRRPASASRSSDDDGEGTSTRADHDPLKRRELDGAAATGSPRHGKRLGRLVAGTAPGNSTRPSRAKLGTPLMPTIARHRSAAGDFLGPSSLASIASDLVTLGGRPRRRVGPAPWVADVGAIAEIGSNSARPRRPAPLWPASRITRWASSVLGVRVSRSRWNSRPTAAAVSVMRSSI